MIIVGQIIRTENAKDMEYGLCVHSYLMGNSRYIVLLYKNGLTQEFSPDEQKANLEDVYFFRNMRSYEYKSSQNLAKDHQGGVFDKAFSNFEKKY